MRSEVLRIGISPCPNDTFVFDALISGKIDTEGLKFDFFLADIENLNQCAFNNEADVVKVSFHAFLNLVDNYVLLDSGSALGRGCGPLLVSKDARIMEKQNVRVAIPGKYTTANLLFSLAYPDITNKKEVIFSDIEDEIISNKADCGLLIHETRFTYQNKGLIKILDLGEYWENMTKLPIPLGGIIAKRKLGQDILQKINRVIRRSLEYAFLHPKNSRNFIKKHAQSLDDEVINSHIKLYVNDYTLSLGEEGRRAIEVLLNLAGKNNLYNKPEISLFI